MVVLPGAANFHSTASVSQAVQINKTILKQARAVPHLQHLQISPQLARRLLQKKLSYFVYNQTGLFENGGMAKNKRSYFEPASFVLDFESGILTHEQIVEGFQFLIDSGVVWQLQGSYGRMARSLIEECHCTVPAGSGFNSVNNN
jgi:hypothetical protein